MRRSRQIRSRTEGWLVGLHLLGLSLPERVDPLTLLEEISGEQRYILDFLTEVVLRRQPQDIQTFLLSTSILEQLSASLCDAVCSRLNSQEMLHQLEQANLFVVSLDSKRQWYRYHALFAEALSTNLSRRNLIWCPSCIIVPASGMPSTTRPLEAILHAFKAQEWQWAADLIEEESSVAVPHVGSK